MLDRLPEHKLFFVHMSYMFMRNGHICYIIWMPKMNRLNFLRPEI